jgi:hypothetical protein
MRKIFGLKREETTGALNKMYNEELHDWYCAAIIIWVITWRRMRWVEHVACTEQREYMD